MSVLVQQLLIVILPRFQGFRAARACSFNFNMASERASGLIIFRRILNRPVEYLLLQASYGTHHWTPPKGHVESGESDEETAFRETEEEAGLKTSNLNFIKGFKSQLEYIVRGRPKKVIYWLAELKDHDCRVKLSAEHQDYEWADLAKACRLVRYEDTQSALKSAEKYLKENC